MNSNLNKFLIGFGFLFVLVVAFALSQNYLQDLPFSPKTPKAIINNQTFNLFLAKTDKERRVGLSEKKSLAENSGMLFVFGKPDYYSFWMKKMQFPIDIIFIKENKIVTIYTDLKPPQTTKESLPIYKPDEPADMVLEINAGLVQKYNLKKGDLVKLENL
ncbi:MAG: DUF192 domain-containing protein [Candidatus Levybacteria bacterium]|nr:DUF192 domain-containing protein [Candidatus Levybacteria bacterium]